MTLNIDKFLATVNKEDLARKNLFKVEFPEVIGLGGSIPEPTTQESVMNFAISQATAYSEPLKRISGLYSPELIRALGGGSVLDRILNNPELKDGLMSMFVRSVAIPEKSIETGDVNTDRLPYKVPTALNYGELTMSFMMTPNCQQRHFLEDWMRKVYNENDFTVGFYDDFVGNIRIKTFDRRGNLKTITEFEKCYPINIGQLDYDYEANNEIATFDVTFSYRKYYSVPITESDPENEFNEAKALFTNVKSILNQF